EEKEKRFAEMFEGDLDNAFKNKYVPKEEIPEEGAVKTKLIFLISFPFWNPKTPKPNLSPKGQSPSRALPSPPLQPQVVVAATSCVGATSCAAPIVAFVASHSLSRLTSSHSQEHHRAISSSVVPSPSLSSPPLPAQCQFADSPNVLIWDVEAQPNRHAVLGATNSRPDLILTGHQDNAEFALAMSPTGPYVLSGRWRTS
ncbi:hypothetical protein PIB30_074369, partial [Stylosanthes scabra]|nr:hypothetical protein [Stylosanthes scabra]